MPNLVGRVDQQDRDELQSHTAWLLSDGEHSPSSLTAGRRKRQFGLLLLIATALSVAACKPKAISPEEFARYADDHPQTTTPAQTADDVMPSTNAEYLGLFEAKGIHLGMFRPEAVEALTSRGFMAAPNGIQPLLEGLIQLPTHTDADTLYVDTATCKKELERHAQMSAEQANSIAGMTYDGCDVAVRVFYDDNDVVVGFYIKPPGFGLDQTDVRQLAEAVVENLPIEELRPATRTINMFGQVRSCTDYVGTAPAGERLTVSDCGFLRMQVQQSAGSAGDFN